MKREIGLRRMASDIGVSATYLSKIERNELPPPAEERIKDIARYLDLDEDDLLARANRVSSDLTEVIREHPQEMATFLRAVRGKPPQEWAKALKDLNKGQNKK